MHSHLHTFTYIKCILWRNFGSFEGRKKFTLLKYQTLVVAQQANSDSDPNSTAYSEMLGKAYNHLRVYFSYMKLGM